MKSFGNSGTAQEWLADGAKVLVGAAVFGLLTFFLCFLTQCGESGGSNNSAPVYDENGNCTENCGDNGDASVTPMDGYYPTGDSCNGDTCSPKPDYVAPPCKVPTDPKIKKMCMPYWTQISKCLSTWDYDVLCGSPEDGLDGKDCYCYGEKAYDPKTNGAKPCDTVADCQPIACEEWPPEVCCGLPCMLVGKWDCEGYINDLTDAEFYDNGDGYCRIHSPTDPNDDLYYKPGDDHVQRPPSGGPIEEKYTVLDGGSQLLGDGSAGTFTCTKMVEEE